MEQRVVAGAAKDNSTEICPQRSGAILLHDKVR
jgi:hypothetical protein